MQVPILVLAKDGRLTLIKKGQFGYVMAAAKVNKFLKKRSKSMIRKREAAESLFKIFCETDMRILMSPSNNRWEREGSYPIKSGSAETSPIWALKNTSLGLRIYGVLCKLEGENCFIATEYDDNKKRQKANPKKLRDAALNFGGLYEQPN